MKKTPWRRDLDEIMLFKNKKGQKKYYRGYGTVWHTYPGGQRCGTLAEADLSDFCEWAKNQRELGVPSFCGQWTKEELK